MTEVSPTNIAERVVEAILAQKLAPGERLGEQALAENFGVSRTMVREALMQLQARGFVEVQSRRGWYVVEPSAEEARDAFAARRIVESGIRRDQGRTADARALYDRLGFQRVPDLDADLRDHLGSCGQGPVPALAYIRPLTPAGVDAASHVDEELAS